MDDLYVASRQGLLNALDALEPHRRALTLVGAHAVYLRVGDAIPTLAPFTTDGDLVVNPAELDAEPTIEDALGNMGFRREDVGTWVMNVAIPGGHNTEIRIDLLVPEGLELGERRRGALLTGHAQHTARIVPGLEGAVVDFDAMGLESLEPKDPRIVEVRVAGSAALLVAKLHKISDRVGTKRQHDKDALDVYRLLRGTKTREMTDRYRQLLEDDRSQAVAENGIRLLREEFAGRAAVGVRMLRRSVETAEDPEESATACVLLSDELLSALER